jgi:hypothetical protein
VCVFECEKKSFEGAADLYSLFLAPTFAYQDMLPQTTAFVLETFRWRPVSAGGMCIQYAQSSN